MGFGRLFEKFNVLRILSVRHFQFLIIFFKNFGPEQFHKGYFTKSSNEDVPIIMRGRENKYLTYRETDSSRFLFIGWVSKHRKTRIVTARDMTQKEKQFYRKRKR
jgi:hypothetical protein